MTEKIPYWQSHSFLRAFVWKDGEEGCEICEDEDVKISLDRLPPPLRDQPTPIKVKVQKTEKEKRRDETEKFLNIVLFPWTVADKIRKVQAWAATPELPKAAKIAQIVPVKNSLPAFDIQQIPSIMRNKISRPLGAAMLERWFEGEENYALSSKDVQAEINQKGEPYPASMIDTKLIKMNWILKFERAQEALDALLTRVSENRPANEFILKTLSSYRGRPIIFPLLECEGDVRRLHREFQFQYSPVESSWAQKVTQYVRQEVSNRGIPDELTFVLGAFSLYAAVGRSTFHRVSNGVCVTVTHIHVYVRDSFDFNDRIGDPSQYLGHWGEAGIAIIPAAQLKGFRSLVDTPNPSRGIRVNRRVWHAVKNSDFRSWRQMHHRGGDYIVYSDTVSRLLPRAISFIIQD